MTWSDRVPHDLDDDETLVALLSDALDDRGSIPDAARRAALAAFDLGHLEGELAQVVADSAVDAPVAGARHESWIDRVEDRFVEVESSHLRVEIELSAADAMVIGQIDPPGADRVTVEFSTASDGVDRADVEIDDLGRFQAPLRPGTMRMHFTTPSGPVVTPWIVR